MICERAVQGSSDGLIASYLSSVVRRSDPISLAIPGGIEGLRLWSIVNGGTSLTLPWPHPVSATLSQPFPSPFRPLASPESSSLLGVQRKESHCAVVGRSVLGRTALENSRTHPCIAAATLTFRREVRYYGESLHFGPSPSSYAAAFGMTRTRGFVSTRALVNDERSGREGQERRYEAKDEKKKRENRVRGQSQIGRNPLGMTSEHGEGWELQLGSLRGSDRAPE